MKIRVCIIIRKQGAIHSEAAAPPISIITEVGPGWRCKRIWEECSQTVRLRREAFEFNHLQRSSTNIWFVINIKYSPTRNHSWESRAGLQNPARHEMNLNHLSYHSQACVELIDKASLTAFLPFI